MTTYTKLDPNPTDDRRKTRNWQVAYRLLKDLVTLDGSVTASIPTRAITATGDLTRDDGGALVNASSGAVTVNLPGAAGVAGRIFYVKKTDSSPNHVTIDPNSTETIDGNLTVTLTYQHAAVALLSDGSNWNIV